MKIFFKTTWELLKGTAKKFKEEDPTVYAAAIAFFTIFSLPSMLIIIVKVIGMVIGDEKVRTELSAQIENLVGVSTAEQVNNIFDNVSKLDNNLLLNIVGIFFIIISATAIFNFIKKALNSIWGVKPKPSKEILKFLRDRLLSILLIIVLGFLMMVSLIIDTILGVFKDFISQLLSGYSFYIMVVLNYLITLGVVGVIFGLIFKYLPDAKIRWKDVSVGALFTAFLFTIGKALFSIILGQTNIATTYGAAGSLAAILFWVFYSSIILLIGAVFTYVYATNIGRNIIPKRNAVKVEMQEVEYDDRQTGKPGKRIKLRK
jgi:membrane protein